MAALTRMLALALTIAWPLSTAVALDITFDDVASVGNPARTVLDAWGYRFTGSFRTIDTPGPGLVDNGSPVYLGQTAGAAAVTVTRSDGRAFALNEFDAAGLHRPPAGSANARQVTLRGLRIAGGLLQASYALSDVHGFTHFPVPGSWHDLHAVTFVGLRAGGAPGALALDNVGVGEGGPAPVPEPGTLALLLLSAVGGGLVIARRRLAR
jgi:hypothetical protein